jgi:hypothetical protein
MSRGLINNNPGNIRKSGVKYEGEKVPSSDNVFKQFVSISWGYRAIFVTLKAYQIRHGLHTIREMITRWAPPNENKTLSYISTVSASSGISPDIPVSYDNHNDMIKIAAAISKVENGVPAVMADVEAGWDLYRNGI